MHAAFHPGLLVFFGVENWKDVVNVLNNRLPTLRWCPNKWLSRVICGLERRTLECFVCMAPQPKSYVHSRVFGLMPSRLRIHWLRPSMNDHVAGLIVCRSSDGLGSSCGEERNYLAHDFVALRSLTRLTFPSLSLFSRPNADIGVLVLGRAGTKRFQPFLATIVRAAFCSSQFLF